MSRSRMGSNLMITLNVRLISLLSYLPIRASDVLGQDLETMEVMHIS